MSHSYSKIFMHLILCTKYRNDLINCNIEAELYEKIKTLIEKDVENKVLMINGLEDHIHVLFKMNSNCNIPEIVKNVKGATAYWINHNSLITEKFVWQTGFRIFSVSEEMLPKIINYIRGQKVKKEYE